MGIRDGGTRQAVLLCKGDRQLIAGPGHDPRVPRLQPVDLRSDLRQLRIQEDGCAVPVERVRDAHQGPLFTSQCDRLVDGQSGRNRVLEEEADEITLQGPDLLADDDRQARGCCVAPTEGAVDLPVVRDRQVGQALAHRCPDHRGRRGQGVEAGVRVAVEVDDRPGSTHWMQRIGHRMRLIGHGMRLIGPCASRRGGGVPNDDLATLRGDGLIHRRCNARHPGVATWLPSSPRVRRGRRYTPGCRPFGRRRIRHDAARRAAHARARRHGNPCRSHMFA